MTVLPHQPHHGRLIVIVAALLLALIALLIAGDTAPLAGVAP